MRDVQVGEAHDQIADRAAVHDQRDIAVCRREYLRNRVAAGSDLRPPADIPDACLGGVDAREKLIEAQLAYRDIGDRRGGVGPCIHRHARDDVAAGDAEIEWIERQLAAVDLEVCAHVVERQFLLGHDALAAELDVGIRGANLLQVERLIGQYPTAALLRRLLRLRADEPGEVLEIEHLRRQIGAHELRFFASIDTEVPGEIAAPNRPLESAEGPGLALVRQMAGEPIRRRRRNRHADNRIKLRQVLTLQRQVEVVSGELERIDQRALHERFGSTDARIHLQRIRILRVAQAEHGTGLSAQCERHALVAPAAA